MQTNPWKASIAEVIHLKATRNTTIDSPRAAMRHALYSTMAIKGVIVAVLMTLPYSKTVRTQTRFTNVTEIENICTAEIFSSWIIVA